MNSASFRTWLLSGSKSIPAGLSLAAGVYAVEHRLLGTRLDKLRYPEDLTSYTAAVGGGMIFHFGQRMTVADQMRVIDNTKKEYSQAYRTFVRYTTLPYRAAVTQPHLTVPLYFLLGAGFALFVVSNSVLDIQLDMLNQLSTASIGSNNEKEAGRK